MPNYQISRTSDKSAYLQLYTALRDDITAGIYRFGDRLPSRRTLAADSKTSIITVEHAYGLLVDEGYAEPKARSGYYVSYRKKDLMPVGTQGEAPVFTYPDRQQTEEEFSFSAFARTMRRVLSKYGGNILIKSPNFGCMELRSVLVSYLARSRGIVIRPEQIVVGAGAEYLYGLIVQMLGRERIYGLEDPSYVQIRRVYEANGARCDMLKMGKRGIMTGELARTEAGVLHVTPYNSYPSGITADASKRREYIDWAMSGDAYVVEDDVDSEFTMSMKAEDTLFSLEPKKHVFYLNTFSKTIAPSVRIGYMILPSELPEELMRKISFYSCTVPVFEQFVLAEFIGSGEFERHVNRVRRMRRKKS